MMDLFDDIFDFDGDGKTSLFEVFLGLKLLGFFDTDSHDNDKGCRDVYKEKETEEFEEEVEEEVEEEEYESEEEFEEEEY